MGAGRVLRSPGHEAVVSVILDELSWRDLLAISEVCDSASLLRPQLTVSQASTYLNDLVTASTAAQLKLRDAFHVRQSRRRLNTGRAAELERVIDIEQNWASLTPRRIHIIYPEPGGILSGYRGRVLRPVDPGHQEVQDQLTQAGPPAPDEDQGDLALFESEDGRDHEVQPRETDQDENEDQAENGAQDDGKSGRASGADSLPGGSLPNVVPFDPEEDEPLRRRDETSHMTVGHICLRWIQISDGLLVVPEPTDDRLPGFVSWRVCDVSELRDASPMAGLSSAKTHTYRGTEPISSFVISGSDNLFAGLVAEFYPEERENRARVHGSFRIHLWTLLPPASAGLSEAEDTEPWVHPEAALGVLEGSFDFTGYFDEFSVVGFGLALGPGGTLLVNTKYSDVVDGVAVLWNWRTGERLMVGPLDPQSVPRFLLTARSGL